MGKSLRAFVFGGVIACALLDPASAVVTSDGTTATRHTTETGLTPDEIALWDQLGTLNGFYVTPVSARQVLAAKHIGGSVGASVSFGPGPNQGTYTTVGFTDDPGSDLRLWELDGNLGSWVPLYTGSSERDALTTIFGLGGDPGPAVSVAPGVGPPPSDLKGWEWGAADGLGSWGENVIDRNTFVAGTGFAIAIDLDRPVFGGLAEECHLSGGDSSGPWFIEEGGTWYLAGVSSLVSGPFQYDDAGSPDGQPFEAMLFDKGGLWENQPAFFNPDQFTDTPSSAFAVRISRHTSWITPLLDSDSDGVPDDADNCQLIPNATQLDTDADGYGNFCDCDFDQDSICGFSDYSLLLGEFGGPDSGIGTDMDSGGLVGIQDFSLLLSGFGGAPGPSALAP